MAFIKLLNKQQQQTGQQVNTWWQWTLKGEPTVKVKSGILAAGHLHNSLMNTAKISILIITLIQMLIRHNQQKIISQRIQH